MWSDSLNCQAIATTTAAAAAQAAASIKSKQQTKKSHTVERGNEIEEKKKTNF